MMLVPTPVGVAGFNSQPQLLAPTLPSHRSSKAVVLAQVAGFLPPRWES